MVLPTIRRTLKLTKAEDLWGSHAIALCTEFVFVLIIIKIILKEVDPYIS